MAKPLGKVLTPEQKENQELRKRLDAMEKIVEKLGGAVPAATPAFSVGDAIPYNKNIKVMSLCNNKLNLATQPRGLGHRYTFEKFGEVKKIQYGDLLLINDNQRNFKEAGYYYIMDDVVVEEEGLTDIYKKILSKDKIESILNNGEGALGFFQAANPKQQKIVLDMIITKLVHGEFIDGNLINEISRVAKFDINARVKDLQENNEIKNE